MTRARILTIGMAIAALAAALLIPAGANATPTPSFVTATAPSSISVQCKSGASNGTLQANFDLGATFSSDNKTVDVSGTSISSRTLAHSGDTTTVNAGTVFPCSGPASYTFQGKDSQGANVASDQKSVTITPVSCPSGDPCNSQT